MVYVALPGSTRSGEKARAKSTPATRPELDSRIGRTISSVVPGYVVDSRITKVPALRFAAIVRVADSTIDRSGPPAELSGVGTQMTTVSALAIAACVRGGDEAGSTSSRATSLVGDVVDVRPSGVEVVDDSLGRVEAHDRVPASDGHLSEGESDVPEADD